MKPHKKKKQWLNEKRYMKKVLSVYFAVHILVFSAFALGCGVSSAARGSERVWRGAQASLVYIDDLNKWWADALARLYEYAEYVKELTHF